jgi:L-lysine 2,3-aminomutase
MSQIFVEGGDLAKSKGDSLTKLTEFLNNIHSLKIQAKIDGKGITISPKATTTKATPRKGAKKKGKKTTGTQTLTTTVSKTRLKVYLKRFINKEGLSDSMRVISGGPDTFTFHEKPILGEQLAPLEEEE